MKKIIDDNTNIIEIINKNTNKIPIVISIPHSGLYLTEEMTEKMIDGVILANSDWYLPELYSFLEELGLTAIINNVNRYVIDPNRELIVDENNDYSKSLIYTKTTFSKDIYITLPSKNEMDNRIEKYYKKYHNELQNLIHEKEKYFKKVYLIDLHSFGKNVNADIVLGNDNNQAMSINCFNKIKKCFTENGFAVSDNHPYKGGFITRKYGSCNGKCESIQIELSYNSYIDRREFVEEEFPIINQELMDSCKKRLKKVFTLIIDILTK